MFTACQGTLSHQVRPENKAGTGRGRNLQDLQLQGRRQRASTAVPHHLQG